MRIAMLTSYYYPHLGGTEKYVEDLAAALRRRGHHVEVFTHTPAQRRSAGNRGEIEVHRIPAVWGQYQPILTFFDYRRLAEFDVLHSHLPPYIFTRRIARLIPEVPHVATYHCDIEINEKYWFFRLPRWFISALNLYFGWLATRALSGCDRIVVTSKSYGAESPVIPRFATRIVPIGVDPERFLETARRVAPGPQPKVRNRLLYVGRLVPSKGVDTLIEAVALLRAKGTPVELTIVGVGECSANLKRMVKALDLVDQVTFAGKVSSAELVRAYLAASLLVLPSVLRLEAFGIVQLEALVLGTPVLASDLPGVREVVEHTGGGYLFERGSSTDLAAKIGEAMADWEGTLRRAESGRSYVLSHYSWDAIAAELEQVYFDAREKPLPVYAKSRSKLLRAFES